MLEAHDCVIGVPDHDHVARGLAPSPAFGPEVKDVMKINVSRNGCDLASLTPCRSSRRTRYLNFCTGHLAGGSLWNDLRRFATQLRPAIIRRSFLAQAKNAPERGKAHVVGTGTLSHVPRRMGRRQSSDSGDSLHRCCRLHGIGVKARRPTYERGASGAFLS
jgi:hypothetical protein